MKSRWHYAPLADVERLASQHAALLRARGVRQAADPYAYKSHYVWQVL